MADLVTACLDVRDLLLRLTWPVRHAEAELASPFSIRRFIGFYTNGLNGALVSCVHSCNYNIERLLTTNQY